MVCTTIFLFIRVVLVSLHDDYCKCIYDGELLPDIILLTQCYHHRGTRLNAMKRFSSLQPMSPPKRFDIFPPVWDAQKV